MFAESVDLLAAAEDLEEYWSPKVVARVNDQYVKVAKLRGHLVWHNHEQEDELFYVLRGNLTIEYEGGRAIHLKTRSIHVVPKGILHNPIAQEDCWIALIETEQQSTPETSILRSQKRSSSN